MASGSTVDGLALFRGWHARQSPRMVDDGTRFESDQSQETIQRVALYVFRSNAFLQNKYSHVLDKNIG